MVLARTSSRFDVHGALRTRGYGGSVGVPALEVLTAQALPVLSGTLTLSTCSNVCILTDYPGLTGYLRTRAGRF